MSSSLFNTSLPLTGYRYGDVGSRFGLSGGDFDGIQSATSDTDVRKRSRSATAKLGSPHRIISQSDTRLHLFLDLNRNWIGASQVWVNPLAVVSDVVSRCRDHDIVSSYHYHTHQLVATEAMNYDQILPYIIESPRSYSSHLDLRVASFQPRDGDLIIIIADFADLSDLTARQLHHWVECHAVILYQIVLLSPMTHRVVAIQRHSLPLIPLLLSSR